MMDPSGAYQDKGCVVFGASGFVGQAIAKHLGQLGANLLLVYVIPPKRSMLTDQAQGFSLSAQIIHRTVTSGDEEGFKEIIQLAAGEFGGLDYLLCTYLPEEGSEGTLQDDLELDSWDKLFQTWVMNTFLVTRTAFPYLTQGGDGRVVFVNTTTGYTGEGEGEGEVTASGSIHECACSSALTGIMTSIARDIIPMGVSVNGIALGRDYRTNVDSIIWATDFWLSGMCDYSCGQILRLY